MDILEYESTQETKSHGHGILFQLPNGMELPWRDYHNVPFPYQKGGKVHRNRSPSLFDINDFHIIVPVEGDRGEVQGDAAEINIKGEIPMSMGFGFLGAFIF